MRITNWIYSLTPEQAWSEFVATSVELFMSFSLNEGYTNITDACESYSKDIPVIYEKPFLQSQLNHIARLLEKHIEDHLVRIGGLTKLRIYTDEELDMIWQDTVDDLMGVLDKFIIRPGPKKW